MTEPPADPVIRGLRPRKHRPRRDFLGLDGWSEDLLLNLPFRLRDQHKVNRETADRLGWTIVHEFTDNDRSAAKADVKRDDFETMLTVLRAGKLPDGVPVQGVVILAEDRLARRPGDYERFVEAITYRDGRVFADHKGAKDLYSEDAESMGLFGAVISKMEVRKMQRRMRRSHRARAEQGIPVGGLRPFGWSDDRLTLNAREADLLRQAAKDFLSGRSLHSIVMDWQRHGVTTVRGKQWTTASLKACLRSARICGWRELDGELVRGDDGEPVKGQWETIISPADWTAIRAVFDARKGHFVGKDMRVGRPHPADYRDPVYLLSSFLRCGRPGHDGVLCNSPLRASRWKSPKWHVYACLSKSEGGCGGVSRRGDLVDLYVSEAVLSKLEEAQFAASENGLRWTREAELEEAKTRRDELTRQFLAKVVSSETFYSLLPSLEDEVNRLRAEKSKVEAAARARKQRESTDVAEIRRRWFLPEEDGGLPISTKRTYIREALHAVIVHPAGRGRRTFDPDLLEPIWRED